MFYQQENNVVGEQVRFAPPKKKIWERQKKKIIIIIYSKQS